MTTLTYTTDGLATQDTPGTEGRKEAQGCQEHLQQQTHSDAGGSERKRDRIIYIENSANARDPFVIQEVGTIQELTEKICDKFPTLCLNMIGMKICDSLPGTIGRKQLEDKIPYKLETLYISLYLKKHTPYYEGKIEMKKA